MKILEILLKFTDIPETRSGHSTESSGNSVSSSFHKSPTLTYLHLSILGR